MRKSRFSLIELLAVVGVIGLLTAIAFPALHLGQTAFKKASVRSKMNALVMAINAYKATYGTFPLGYGMINGTASATNEKIVLTDSKTVGSETKSCGAWLRDILVGDNARKINFLSGDNLDIGVKNTASNLGTIYKDYWRSGREVAEASGNDFIIYMDVYNYDNQITGPGGSTYAAPVLIYSKGPNGADNGGGGDDIVSWKK